MGSGPGSPFGLEDPGCLILEDLQTLQIPTNKKRFGHNTVYKLFLSLVATFLLSRKV